MIAGKIYKIYKFDLWCYETTEDKLGYELYPLGCHEYISKSGKIPDVNDILQYIADNPNKFVGNELQFESISHWAAFPSANSSSIIFSKQLDQLTAKFRLFVQNIHNIY